MDSVSELLGGSGVPLPGKKSECCPSLSFKQRVKGFVICCAFGGLCGLLSTVSLFVGGGIVGFAVLYTFSNIFGVASSFFITGPKKQLKKLAAPQRWVAVIVFFGAMAGTLWAALGPGNGGLVILFVIIQFLALIWYTLTFIPGAQALAKRCIGRAVENV